MLLLMETKNILKKNEKLVVEKLPELTEEELRKATHEDCIVWISSIANQPIGDIWTHDDEDENSTFSLFQIVSRDSIRCLRVFDHDSSYWYISMVQATCKAAGISLEVGPYTIISSIEEFVTYLQQEIEEQTGVGPQVENDEETYTGWV